MSDLTDFYYFFFTEGTHIYVLLSKEVTGSIVIPFESYLRYIQEMRRMKGNLSAGMKGKLIALMKGNLSAGIKGKLIAEIKGNFIDGMKENLIAGMKGNWIDGMNGNLIAGIKGNLIAGMN